MSFYASSPAPTADPVAPTNPTFGWSATLDQLILQQQAQPAQMGALRRQDSTLAETIPSELPNYAAPVDNDRLLLEALGNQEIQRNTVRQSASNHLDPSAPQTNVNNYHQTWERPGFGISGCNVSSLPQEAYQMPNDLNLDTAAVEDFTSRDSYPQSMPLGPYIRRLVKFGEEQQRPAPDSTLETFWKPLFERFFAPDAIMRMEIKSGSNQELRLMKLPVEALPRIWMSKFNTGVQEERLLMENPCEFVYPNGCVVVECRKTVILTKYEQSTVITNGHLRVHFHRDKKIMHWHFYSGNHQELFPGSSFTMGVARQPPSAICEYGIPQRIERLMHIAEVIGRMRTEIDAKISRLRSESMKAQQAQGPLRQLEQKPPAGYGGLSKGESNGNAYHAMLSHLGGVQGISVDQALGDAPVGHAATASGSPVAPTVQGLAGTVVQGLQNNLAVHLKQNMGNGDPSSSNIRDTIASWRPDQSGDVFPNMFEDTMRTPFAPQEGNLGARRAGQNQEDLEAKKQMTSNLTTAQEPHADHSVVDAVAAVASGQGGWGVGSTAEHNFTVNGPQGDGLDPSLQLLNAIPTEGNLNLQPGGEALGNNGLSQRAPPGLSTFTPQAELEKSGKSQTTRKKGQSTARREVRSSSNRPVSSGNHKSYNGVRTFQRMSSNKMKRGNQSSAPPNVSGASGSADVIRVSQGVDGQNRGASVKGSSTGSAVKPVKDHGQGSLGARRSAQRNSGSDGREKRQKTVQTGNQT